MLTVVTKRDATYRAIVKACDTVRTLSAMEFTAARFDTLEEAQANAERSAYLILDLSTVEDEDFVVEFVATWSTQNDSSRLVLIGPMTSEQWAMRMRVAYALSPFCQGKLIDDPESRDIGKWEDLLLAHPLAIVIDILLAKLETAIIAQQPLSSIPNWTYAKQYLAMAPKNPRVSDVAETTIRNRKSVQNRLCENFARAGQASPSEFIAAFRLLIYLFLREQYYNSGKRTWRTRDIEWALSQEMEPLGRSLRQRTGQSLKALGELGHERIIPILVAMLVPSTERRSLKQHLAAALKATGRSISTVRSLRVAVFIPLIAALCLLSVDLNHDGVPDTVQRIAVSYM